MRTPNSLIYNTVAIILTAVVFVFSWKLILPRYFDHRYESQKLETEVVSTREKFNSLQETKNTLASITDITSKVFVAVPGDADEPDLISELEAIALKRGIAIPSISIGDSAVTTTSNSVSATPATDQNNSTVAISFSVGGSFESLSALISDIESDLRFMNIKALSFTSDEKNGQGLSLQIEAYKRPGPAATSTTSAGQ